MFKYLDLLERFFPKDYFIQEGRLFDQLLLTEGVYSSLVLCANVEVTRLLLLMQHFIKQ